MNTCRRGVLAACCHWKLMHPACARKQARCLLSQWQHLHCNLEFIFKITIKVNPLRICGRKQAMWQCVLPATASG